MEIGTCGRHDRRFEVVEEWPDPGHSPIGGVAVTRYCAICVIERLTEERDAYSKIIDNYRGIFREMYAKMEAQGANV